VLKLLLSLGWARQEEFFDHLLPVIAKSYRLGEKSVLKRISSLINQDRLPPALVLVSIDCESADGVIVDKEARLFAFAGDRDLPAVEIRSKVLEIVELSRNRPIDDVSDNSGQVNP